MVLLEGAFLDYDDESVVNACICDFLPNVWVLVFRHHRHRVFKYILFGIGVAHICFRFHCGLKYIYSSFETNKMERIS